MTRSASRVSPLAKFYFHLPILLVNNIFHGSFQLDPVLYFVVDMFLEPAMPRRGLEFGFSVQSSHEATLTRAKVPRRLIRYELCGRFVDVICKIFHHRCEDASPIGRMDPFGTDVEFLSSNGAGEFIRRGTKSTADVVAGLQYRKVLDSHPLKGQGGKEAGNTRSNNDNLAVEAGGTSLGNWRETGGAEMVLHCNSIQIVIHENIVKVWKHANAQFMG